MATVKFLDNGNAPVTEKIELLQMGVFKDIEFRNKPNKIYDVVDGKLVVVITLEKGTGGINNELAHQHLVRVMRNMILGKCHIRARDLTDDEVVDICGKLGVDIADCHIGGLQL